MSPLTRERILSAADFVRFNWPTNPAAARAYTAQLRTGADEYAATASDDDGRRKAAALNRAAAAAESVLAELEGVAA